MGKGTNRSAFFRGQVDKYGGLILALLFFLLKLFQLSICSVKEFRKDSITSKIHME